MSELPTSPVAFGYLRRNADNTAYETRTPAQVRSDLTLPTFNFQSFLGTNRYGIRNKGGLFLHEDIQQSQTSLGRVLFISADYNYTGGQPGWTNGALQVEVTAQSGPTDFIWASTAVFHNYASGGENVGYYAQSNQHGIGSTWAMVGETCDHKNRASQSGDGWTWAAEFDVWCSHADNANVRHGIVIPIGHREQVRNGNANPGNKATGYVGAWIGPAGGADNLAQWKYGVIVEKPIEVAFLANGGGSRAFALQGTWGIGLDFTFATVTGPAIRLKEGLNIAFDVNDKFLIRHDAGAFRFVSEGNQNFAVTDTGNASMRGELSLKNGNLIIKGTSAAAPANPTTPTAWLDVTFNGTPGRVAFHAA